jgi:two-component system, NarL family, sensor histidine kinase DesK
MAIRPGQYRGMSAFTLLRRRSPGIAPAAGGIPSGAERDPVGLTEDISPYTSHGRVVRQVVILAAICYFLIVPPISAVAHDVTPASLFMLVGAVAFVGIVARTSILPASPPTTGPTWAVLALILALAVALFVVGTVTTSDSNAESWVTILAVAAAGCGRFTSSIRPAALSAMTCTATGLVMGWQQHYGQGYIATVLILPPMAAFFAYTAGKRNEMVVALSRTRAELAKVAVAEERLRIARDLHDLLGHSLSLITLKAELSRRVIGTDAERAVLELAELEAVARQSLSDVREAVAGYRQPDLAAELAAARQLLTAAGIACLINAPRLAQLPGDVDAALAWTVREGVTNVVRHAGATAAQITVTSGTDVAVVEVTDDGGRVRQAVAAPASLAPPIGPAGAGSAELRHRRSGSGLAGLAERVRQLGGEVTAGPRRPHGFRLRVTIPVGEGA